MRIAFGYGRGVVLKIKKLSFEELANLCKVPKKGDKYCEYFIRGGNISITEGDPSHLMEAQKVPHYHRNNKTLLEGELLILDGDASEDNKESAPPPELIHKELKKLKINHFIYTSHSHNPDKKKIRWRAVVPCFVSFEDVKINSDAVKLTTNQLFDKLSKTGLAKSAEQNVWSQPWYMPTRDNPEDGHFQYFEYFKGGAYKAISPEKLMNYDPKVSISKQTLDYESIEDVYDDFMKGKHCYTSMRKITYMNVKDGQTRPATISNAKVLMEASPLKKSDPERWEKTFVQIEKLVEDAYAKIHADEFKIDLTRNNDFDDDDIIVSEKHLLPKNDLITELTKALHKTWWTPNMMASRLAAMSIVAYLAGGKYRSSLGDRVNIQQICIGPTGSGKDILINSIIRVVQHVFDDKITERDKILSGIIEEVGSAEGVDGRLRSMGDKHDIMLCIDEVGGLLRQAKRDIIKQKFFDYALKMYTKSDGVLADRAVSRKLEKGQAEILYAPHMIMSGATTPKLILSGMDSDFVSFGSASRMMFFNCGPYAEENIKKLDELNLSELLVFNLKAIYDQKEIEKIHPLPTARVFSPKIVDMSAVEDYCWKYSKKDRSKIGQFKDIWNRRVANAKKYAMIRAIINNPDEPIVTLDIIENEMMFVGASCEYSERVFKNMVGDSELDVAKKSVVSRLLKALKRNKTLVPQRTLNDTYAMRKIQPHQRKAILAELVEDGVLIKTERPQKSGRGKKQVLYEFSDAEEYQQSEGIENV